MLGVSPDSPETLSRFRDAHGVPFSFASDPKREVIGLYGARRRLPLASTRRATFVIDRSGTIRGAFQHELAIGRHARDVLNSLASLASADAGGAPC